MDDFYLVGPPKEVLCAFDRFCNVMPKYGLQPNLAKCKALLPSLSDGLVRECKDRDLAYSDSYVNALGTILSRDPVVVSDYLVREVTEKHKPFFTALLDQRLSHQHFFTLLRTCMVPRMNYLARVTHPTSFAEAAQAFDRLVKDTFCQRLKLPAFTDVAHVQLELPVRLGGFGLSGAQIVSPVAWYCSFAQAYRSVSILVIPVAHHDEL